MASATTERCRRCVRFQIRCIKEGPNQSCRPCLKDDAECSLIRVTATRPASQQTESWLRSDGLNSETTAITSAASLTREQETTSTTSDLYHGLLSGKSNLHLGNDIGTSKCSVMFQILENAVRNTFEAKGLPLTLADDHCIPTEAVIVVGDDGSAELKCGHEVEAALENGEAEESDVFRYLKLTLLPAEEQRFAPDSQAIRELHASHNTKLHSAASKKVTLKLKYQDDLEMVINSTEDVFCLYLRWLWDRCMGEVHLRTKLGRADLIYVFKHRTKVAVSVPAIWTDKMIDRFHNIMSEAGFCNVSIVSEPKCAAASVASEIQSEILRLPEAVRHERIQQVKSTLSIHLDVGHGTADLTTCRIDELEPDLKVANPIMGHGSLWGSKTLNDFFREKVPLILGEHLDTISTSLDLSKEAVVDMFVRGFEKAKRQYSSMKREDIKVTFPNGFILPTTPALPSLRKRYLVVSSEIVHDIFLTYVSHLETLVNHQLEEIENLDQYAHYKREIICCGGASRNDFIFNTLSDWFAKRGIPCYMKEQRDYSIVARGAFLATINPELGSRRFARTSFGTKISVKWDKNQHTLEERRRAHICSGWVYEVRDRMLWLVMLGENIIEPTRPLVASGYTEVVLRKTKPISWPLELEQDIYGCEQQPIATTQEVSYEQNKAVIHPACRLVIKIPYDKQSFTVHKARNGQQFYQINWRAIAKWTGMELIWYLVVHKTGEFPDENFQNWDDCIVETQRMDGVLDYDANKFETREGMGEGEDRMDLDG